VRRGLVTAGGVDPLVFCRLEATFGGEGDDEEDDD